MAVNAQGEVAWTVDLGAAVRIPALGPDGRLYVGTAAGELFALQGAAGPAPSSWPQYQRDAQHTGSLESYLEAGAQGEMVLNGIPGRAYRIEWSAGVSGGWQTLTNATQAADTLAFTDPAATAPPASTGRCCCRRRPRCARPSQPQGKATLRRCLRERLPPGTKSAILSDMKTVTLRSFRRDAALLDRAAGGEELLVTRFGQPYIRVVPAKRPRTFVGAGRHLGVQHPISSEPIPASEWKGLV